MTRARIAGVNATPALHVLIDGRPLQGPTGRRGVGRYVAGLACGLARQLGPCGRLSFLLDPRDPPAAIEIPAESVVPAGAPPGPALAWGLVLGPRWIGAASPDVFHAT